MTKIISTHNSGNKTLAKLGTVRINGGNLYAGGNVLATPSTGTVITEDMLAEADFFQCAQTAATTDLLLLPDAAPIGTSFTIYVISVFALRAETATRLINGVAGSDSVWTPSAGDLIQVTKVVNTGWMAVSIEADGAIVQVVPAT